MLLSCSRSRFCGRVCAFVLVFGFSTVASAEPQDSQALRLGGNAISSDYMGGRFETAKQKLESALRVCINGSCSPKVVAGLYRDLGVVYLGGLNKPKHGKEALRRAVKADPNVQLDPDLTTPEIARAFKEVGGRATGQRTRAEKLDVAPPPPKPRKGKRKAVAAEDIVLEEEEGAEEEASERDQSETPTAAGGAQKNWFSVALQQDFFLHKETQGVCGGVDYVCFGPGDVEYTGNIDQDAGNQAAGGFGVATTRILLGYDRLFTPQITAGARLGLAFRGAPTSSLAGKFFPLHLELRGSYFFGSDPFERTGFRPYAGLSVGVVEVDAHIKVDYFDNGERGTLDAWRKTGRGYFALNGGTQFALAKNSAITAEARLQIMMGTSGIAPALALGYAHSL